MQNPTCAIDAILETEKTIDDITIYPMSLARYALLEIVQSPFITRDQKFTVSNLVPSFYIMCSPIADIKGITSKNIDVLNDKALEWAEKLPNTVIDKLIPEIMASLGLINKVAPNTTDNTSKKATV